MSLVKNAHCYWDFIRSVRNHPEVKEGFIQQSHISQESHLTHMQAYSSCYYVCLVDNVPAGYVGVIEDDIRVSTHPDFQKKGVGSFMISELVQRHPAAIAKVKIDNEASLKLFEKCGFRRKYYLLERE